MAPYPAVSWYIRPPEFPDTFRQNSVRLPDDEDVAEKVQRTTYAAVN
jgi:hypothetical protein